MPRSTNIFEELTEDDLVALADILCHPVNASIGPLPNSVWLSSQASRVGILPEHLHRPTGLSSFLSGVRQHLPFAPTKAIICDSHKELNPFLIHDMFLRLSNECTVCLERFKTCTIPPGTEIAAWMRQLSSLNSLWMSPNLYRVVFEVTPQEPRFAPVRGHCEACILAVVGGDAQALQDLRTAIRGRKKKGREHGGLWPMIELWVNHSADSKEILRQSKQLGRQVRMARWKMQRERLNLSVPDRVRGSNSRSDVQELPVDSAESLPGEDEEVYELGDNNDDDPELSPTNPGFENSIFEYYLRRLSNAGFTDTTASTELLQHFQSRDHQESTSDATSPPANSGMSSSWLTDDGSSVYSRDEGFAGSTTALVSSERTRRRRQR